jgi:hypothetical protein
MQLRLAMPFLDLVACFACAGVAQAQRPAPELRGRIGASWFLDEDLPTHLTAGASVRAYVTRRFAVEPEFLHIRHSNFTSDRYYVFLANLVYDLADPERRVAPYVIGGVGLFHSRTRFPLGPGFTANDPTFVGGTGARLNLTDRLYFFPEIRIGVEPNIYLTLTGGLGIRLGR